MSNWSSKISRVTMYLMTNRAGIFIKDVVFKRFFHVYQGEVATTGTDGQHGKMSNHSVCE